MIIQCFRCNRTPEEIEEYSPEMTETDMSPTDYVIAEEGTFNDQNGHFACTACYIAIGMPTSRRGWVAP